MRAVTEGGKGLKSRKAALAILSNILRRRKPLDSQLDELAGMETRDAGFARALASQTLRHLGELDAAVQHCLSKPLAAHKAGAASEILLLGACELLILKGAPHAAVDAANRLAQSDSKAVHFKPLINAVLRRLARDGEAWLDAQDRTRLSVPDWLWGRWSAQYGEATARAIAQAHRRQAPTDISVKNAPPPGAVPLFGISHRLTEQTRIDTLPGFADGDWWVQDAAAALPVHLLGDVAGQSVIDLCAAPGGKTLQLAAKGAKVIAVEREATRMARVAENLARVKLEAALVTADARDVTQTAPFVLIDAPCTATGTIRRHPDLPWIKAPGDVTAQAATAREILEHGATLVEAGGLLVFAVCSLEREEGEEQVAAFLNAHPEFARVKLTPDDVFGHGEWINAEGDLRTLPCHLNEQGGMDGFYAARLKRS